MDGWVLRTRRRAAGLTLAQVARAAGTAETNIAAYERGDKVPRPQTLARIEGVIEAGAHSPVVRNRLLTVPATAAALRQGLRAGWPTVDLLRLVKEMRSNAKWASSAADRAAFFARPATTGDQRWDALIAGVVEDCALHEGLAPPPWVRQARIVPGLWFVGEHRVMDAWALAHTPPALRVRGVVLDETELVAV